MLNPTVLLCGPSRWDETVDALRLGGYRVARARRVADAESLYHAHRPDLVVLEGGDRSADVHDVLRRLRTRGRVPVVVAWTGSSTAVDVTTQLVAFAAGADDVVPVAGEPRLLTARVGAVLRRSVSAVSAAALPRVAGPLRLDPESRIASVAGAELDLTRIEFDLLAVLMEQPSRVVPRDELVSRVWGAWYGDDHVVEVHLSRLRAKVTKVGGPRIGVAVRGVGYRLGVAAEPARSLVPRQEVAG